MLKELRSIWKNNSIMHQAVEALAQMVTDAEYGYTHAWEACIGQAVAEKVQPEIKGHDKAVNKAERSIRRLIVEHLSINPGRDVSGCLALMLMAKDIERIGDHTRNIFRVGLELKTDIAGFKLYDMLAQAQGEVGALLPDLRRAIQESSDEIAHAVLSAYQSNKTCLKELEARLQTEDMGSLEAVNSALLTRYFIRTNAHIGNAASGVIFPLENIDFVSRGLRKEQEKA